MLNKENGMTFHDERLTNQGFESQFTSSSQTPPQEASEMAQTDQNFYKKK
jgi:hypothetical protein